VKNFLREGMDKGKVYIWISDTCKGGVNMHYSNRLTFIRLRFFAGLNFLTKVSIRCAKG
jgi:hypothetical protein